MAVYGPASKHNFSTIDDAYEYFGAHYSYKYDILWCYVGNKLSCIIGSSMAEDYEYINDFYKGVESLISEAGDPMTTENLQQDITSELRDKMYDLIESWGIADIYYYTDNF